MAALGQWGCRRYCLRCAPRQTRASAGRARRRARTGRRPVDAVGVEVRGVILGVVVGVGVGVGVDDDLRRVGAGLNNRNRFGRAAPGEAAKMSWSRSAWRPSWRGRRSRWWWRRWQFGRRRWYQTQQSTVLIAGHSMQAPTKIRERFRSPN